uniref:DNA-directed DNA polymerase n=1 Tax=Siphoviridae sp. ctWWc42 TaxID=2826361 RepID=A0A8S5R226_9CAUD|nr:MAG TPA: DNA polymerase [Siphoviridae sp. ctWWc42]
MLDFVKVVSVPNKKGGYDIIPKFIIKRSSDLMIRGGDFYAVWDESKNLWSVDEQDAIQMIDDQVDRVKSETEKKYPDAAGSISAKYLWDSNTGSIDKWHRYCQKQMRDSYHMLDETIIFSNQEVTKESYASRRLSYPLIDGDHSAFDKIISTLYSQEERHKIEWAIGSIVSGDSKTIQKFMVLYGAAGTGKSTILNIIQMLFEGYYSVFDAKALGSSNNSFALEAFKSNPLVAIQHDGDLSKIEDNTRLNSLVAHEQMTINEKFKSTYTNSFKCFLFMGTNKPVKITDGKSGLIRRLIDVTPTGKKIPTKEYKTLMSHIPFELGPIAKHCLDVYSSDPGYYDTYIPVDMMGASNDFYNFVIDSYSVFDEQNGVSLKAAWEMYKTYCDEAKVSYPFSKRIFKEELKNYFDSYTSSTCEDSSKRNQFYGFKRSIFSGNKRDENESIPYQITLSKRSSIFDETFGKCAAQYATENETPNKKWDLVTTKLEDLDTSKLHYVRVPENHIVIDFDLKDENGNKDLEKNIVEASKWPKTYAETSKSGSGIHLHYNYIGDVSKLSCLYSEGIEVKVFSGKSALRRKLTLCNNEPIANISSGLPLKEDKKVIDREVIKDEKKLRALINKALCKKIHPNTKSNVDFIYKVLTEAYDSGINYNVSDMYNDVYAFAAMSTNQSDYCLKLIKKMPFKSKEENLSIDGSDVNNPLVFFDIEVFKNLFLVNWKVENSPTVTRMINPTPTDIEKLLKFRLVGFNCRRYDNHILYARFLGYSNIELYKLSQRIISGDKSAFFGEAYNISYTDVYDFCKTKQSLKKWEIDLGIHHQELGLPWDEEVPENLWPKVAEYCDNDVISTEAVYHANMSDFAVRQVLAKVANGSVNDTTNSLSAKIIFGKNRHPQDQFNYRNLGDTSGDIYDCVTVDGVTYNGFGDEYVKFDSLGRPVFPGYKFDHGISTYRGEEVGEGGYVYSEPGMYSNVALLDIASMHPSTIIAECLFGVLYTKRFEDIKAARIAIKHHNYDTARTMLDGALNECIDEIEQGLLNPDDLAQALKIVINSIYGLTAAGFDNPFRDKRNIDNIVAKRGALFMVNLKHAVQQKGFTVAHIKTDSIKIPGATNEIIQFVMDFGKQYGYTFEHEATYAKMCLVNGSVYIARYDTKEDSLSKYGYIPEKVEKHGGEWTATGTQFQVPYVFKTLFTHEPIEFSDMCETKSVKTAMYLDMNEESVSDENRKLEKLTKYMSPCKETEGYNKIAYDIDGGEFESVKRPNYTEHNYIFIGKVGLFCPIKQGCGGGLLVRENVGKDGNKKYDSVTGTKGYRWLEAEMVSNLNKQADIDRSYYEALVNEAKDNISKYGDFEWLVA